MKKYCIPLIGLSLALTISMASVARADDLPVSIRSQHEPTPVWQERSQTLDLPTSPSNPVLEIPGQQPNPAQSSVLPSPFVGCWEGTIEDFDSLTPIGFLSSMMRASHSTYTYCYLPNPDGETYRLEFRKLSIAERELTPTAFTNQVVWVDDPARRGYLRNHLTVIQTSWLLIFPFHVQEDAYAEEIVTVKDENTISMRGAELIKLEGQDYARTEFHADLHRIPEN